MVYWVYRPEPQPTQAVRRVPPSALITGDQPPRRTNGQYFDLVGRWWPADKEPYPAQIRRTYIAPQTLVYGQQPPRKTNAQLFNVVNRQWPLDKEPYPNQLWKLDLVPISAAVVVNNPPPYSRVNMMVAIQSWPLDKEPRLPTQYTEPPVTPLTLRYGNQPPIPSKVNLATIRTAWEQVAPPPTLENQNAAWNVADSGTSPQRPQPIPIFGGVSSTPKRYYIERDGKRIFFHNEYEVQDLLRQEEKKVVKKAKKAIQAITKESLKVEDFKFPIPPRIVFKFNDTSFNKEVAAINERINENYLKALMNHIEEMEEEDVFLQLLFH